MEKKEKTTYEKPEMDVVELENDVIWTNSGDNSCTVYLSEGNYTGG